MASLEGLCFKIDFSVVGELKMIGKCNLSGEADSHEQAYGGNEVKQIVSLQ